VKPRVLVVDDEPPQLEILRLILGSEGHEVATAPSGKAALAALRRQPFDVVLTDLKMPDLSGIALLEEIQREQPGACVVLMAAHGSIDSAVEAMRKGAFDYLTKPLDREVLLLAVSRAVERTRLVSENRRLREELRGRFRVENLVGAHGSMQEVFRVVHKVARSSSTVLIYGESGTGKELVARALHVTSERRDRPFLAVNVGALPETILEAELFGYEKGAFTGADARKIGLFEQASGSTLFLDEVGELRRELQVKLLRVLQEREILRVGGTEAVPVDVRVVAATNRDLEREVREGRFREDLFYRLNVIPIALPPLRERRTDIPLLVEHFLAKHGEPGRPRRIAPEALEALVGYSWPGNVRELESVVERTLLLADGDVVGLDDLPPAVRMRVGLGAGSLPIEVPDEGLDLEELERRLILRALEKSEGNVTRAGRLLGLSRRTLQYRLEKIQGAPDGAADAPNGAAEGRDEPLPRSPSLPRRP
jgi:two-component system response regulator PilR (NtrC family)